MISTVQYELLVQLNIYQHCLILSDAHIDFAISILEIFLDFLDPSILEKFTEVIKPRHQHVDIVGSDGIAQWMESQEELKETAKRKLDDVSRK